MIPASSPATLIGLAVALFGPAVLFTPARKVFGPPDRMLARVLDLGFLWILAGLVSAIVVGWEKLPLSSIGLQPTWRSLLLGLALALAFNRVVGPFLYRMLRMVGGPGFETGLTQMASMPLRYLYFAALTAGVAEEVFRGYSIERLAWLTGSYWWAGLISTAVFALLHLPMWGWGPVATFFVSGGLLTLFYIWTQDLTACMIAHAITDAAGFLGAHRAAVASRISRAAPEPPG